MGVACLEFRGENFRGWLKNREIRESFLPRKFPAIRYSVKAYQGINQIYCICCAFDHAKVISKLMHMHKQEQLT